MQAKVSKNFSRTKIKILYVMDYFYSPFGGTEGQLHNLISNLDRKQFDPELLLYRQFSFEPYLFQRINFHCEVNFLHFYSFYSLRQYKKLFQLRRYIKEKGFDIVHVFFNDAAMTVPIVCAGLGVKVITSRRDMGYWYTPANLIALRLNAKFIDRYVVNSYAVKENIKRREHIPSERLVVIYNGHDFGRFKVNEQKDFHQALSIPEGAKIIGMVANYRPLKRVEDLIRAFPNVLREIPNCYLVIVGDMYDSYKKCNDLAKLLGVEENVRFLGKTNDVIPLIKHFTVGVNCSESEGLSNTIIEYMGCDVPVVCSNNSGNRELVQDGKNGFLYQVGNIYSLASCIVKLLENINLRNELAKNAKKAIAGRFTQDKIITQYENFYRHLLKRN